MPSFLFIPIDLLVLFYGLFYGYCVNINPNRMNLPTINVVFNYRNSKTISGLYPIFIRITINRTSKYVLIPIPQNISKTEWNAKNNGVNFIKNSHPYAFEINEKIREFRNKAIEVVKRCYNQNKTIAFESVLHQIQGKN